MTEITGKIYQMKNAAGTENRFPRTVIEGVLGLSSYLQTQFSSLANIYMPIEGIHEAKTGQEFVYRATPNTIKANLLNLDKIYGKSLGWNQLVKNGDFTNGGTDWHFDGTGSVSNGIATISGGSGYTGISQSGIHPIQNHVYYYHANVCLNESAGFRAYFGDNVTHTLASTDLTANVWTKVSGVSLCDVQPTNYIQQGVFSSGTLQIKNIICIDLTLLFNGNVPENYTVADFERDFPELYYPYDSGRLINNDAESMECVGRNVWDEEWENGVYAQASGEPGDGPSRLRCKNYIPVFGGVAYYAKSPVQLVILPYDANKNYLGADAVSFITNNVFTRPEGAAFIRFYTGSDLTQYNYDICINLSDTSFNGQYEPYWKVTRPLNLNNFKVKSPNIWDEEFESGYWDTADGQAEDSANWKRSKNKTSVLPNTTYQNTKDGDNFVVLYYDANDNYINAYSDTGSNNPFTTPNNAAYIRFYCTANTTYCSINKSDPAFNGRYFSHEDITITGGLKGNGDWADMIVGNKYVKKAERVDLGDLAWVYDSFFRGTLPLNSVSNGVGVCSKYSRSNDNGYKIYSGIVDKEFVINGTYITSDINKIFLRDTDYSDADAFKTAMSGVMLDYQLQYPETYELVTPIATSLRAGTTETRISPNSYGLSAPMVCDITYSVVQDASSADDAQYSVTAGKLLNTHKIWGQDFDGTQDVSGALTGVTSIDSLINIADGYVGIGKTPSVALDVNGQISGTQLISTVTSSAPLVVSSSALVTNLNAEKVGGCTVEQITAPLAEGIASNASRIQSLEDWLVNPSLDELTADELNVIESLRVGKGIFVWDSTNNALRFKGNFYADGFVTAYGTNESEALEALKAWVTANFEPKQS